jgi:hypothetical protein
VPVPVRESESAPVQESASVPESESAPETTSDPDLLARQLELLDESQALARAGKHAAALGMLDRLEREFPSTPLSAEIDLSRVELLRRAGRNEQSLHLAQKLLARPQHAGRRAELHQLLGDLWLESGDCERAVLAFRAALSAGLQGKRAAAVQRGLRRCEKP